MRKTILVLIVSLFAVLHAAAHPDILFNNISTKDGLPSPHVYSVTQDDYGIIWMGTDEGLFRYDGATFTLFMHNPKEYKTSWVNCLYSGSDGRIWIGSENGLLFYNHQSGKVELCTDPCDPEGVLCEGRVKSIIEDSNHILWVGKKEGLIKYDYTNGHLDFFQLSQFKDRMTQEMTSFHEDSEGNLWIGSFHGLYKFDSRNNSSKWFEARPDGSHEQWNNLVMKVVESPSDPGVLYVATSSGLVCMSKEGEIIRQITTSNSNICDNDIRSLGWYDEHNLLAGTANGVSLIDCRDFSIESYRSRNDESISLADNSVRDIFKDRSGMIWIATLKGISRLNPARKPISLYRFSDNGYNHKINDIARYKDEFWLGTNNGIVVCDTLFHKKKSFTEANGLLHPIIKRILVDRNGCLWIGTNNGINIFDRSTGRFKAVIDKEDEVRFKYIYDIKQSKSGEIVSNIPNGIGIITPHYSTDSSRVVSYRIRKMDIPCKSPEREIEMAFMCFSSDGYLWMCLGPQGLMRYSLSTGENILFTEENGLPNNLIYSLYCDSDNTIWVGSPTGLCSIDSNLQITDYSNEISMSGSIHSIAGTSGDEVCLATYDKLILFNPTTRGTNVCNLDEDLGVSELVHNSVYATTDNIYLGGDGQVIRFNPDELDISEYAPDINIISLTVSGSEDHNNNGESEISLVSTDRIKLPYYQNSFSILFAMPAYTSSEDNGYRYRLEGLEQGWTDTSGKNNRVSYTNLHWGRYKFQVHGHNSDGIWSDNIKSLEIVITPPWWASTLAYIIYSLLALAVILGASYFLIMRVKLRSALKMEKMESIRAQQLNDMKLRFFTNISHEFKTPLALISGPLEVLMEQIKDPDQVKELEIIQQNSDRLSRLINQIMDIRRIDNGKIALELSHGDIIQFIKDIFLSFGNSAKGKNVRLSYNSGIDHLLISFDRDKVEKIIMNLMSNAMKFTKSDGEIRMDVDIDVFDGHDSIVIKISDTGCGIPEDELPMIFDRFYQTRDGSNVNGSGIGLSIVKEYVELHNGNIGVESEPGKGTQFTLCIPCDLESGEEKSEDRVQIDSLKNKVVIIDDEYDMLSFMKMNLEKNFNVYLATDGETGCALIKEVYPDLIICDLMMPGMDGYEVCRMVKGDDLLCHIPFIILTAKDDSESRREGYEYGADDYIAKPFSVKSLITRVNTLISMRNKIRNSFKMQFIASPKDVDTDTSDRMISKLVRTVEENISDPGFGIQQLCDKSKYPYQQVYRKIKSYTGQTINEFIRNIRLQRAAQLLRDPNYRISEVIDMVGFNSHSYFTKCFKELFGVSPTDYNKKSRLS